MWFKNLNTQKHRPILRIKKTEKNYFLHIVIQDYDKVKRLRIIIKKNKIYASMWFKKIKDIETQTNIQSEEGIENIFFIHNYTKLCLSKTTMKLLIKK